MLYCLLLRYTNFQKVVIYALRAYVLSESRDQENYLRLAQVFCTIINIFR